MMNLLKVPGKQEHHRVQQARQKPAEFNCLLEQFINWKRVSQVPAVQSQAELGSVGQLQRSGQGPLKTARWGPERNYFLGCFKSVFKCLTCWRGVIMGGLSPWSIGWTAWTACKACEACTGVHCIANMSLSLFQSPFLSLCTALCITATQWFQAPPVQAQKQRWWEGTGQFPPEHLQVQQPWIPVGQTFRQSDDCSRCSMLSW